MARVELPDPEQFDTVSDFKCAVYGENGASNWMTDLKLSIIYREAHGIPLEPYMEKVVDRGGGGGPVTGDTRDGEADAAHPDTTEKCPDCDEGVTRYASDMNGRCPFCDRVKSGRGGGA